MAIFNSYVKLPESTSNFIMFNILLIQLQTKARPQSRTASEQAEQILPLFTISGKCDQHG